MFDNIYEKEFGDDLNSFNQLYEDDDDDEDDPIYQIHHNHNHTNTINTRITIINFTIRFT